jgi:Flp pilus assembly secretin CpaC
VLLQVHVAEATRQALRELGFSVRALGDTLQMGATPGNAFFPGWAAWVRWQARGLADNAVGKNTPDFAFPGATSSCPRDADYATLVRALAERNLFRTLAKPNLITQSGKEAKFLSGGEFPYPVSQDEQPVTIEFKEFGVGSSCLSRWSSTGTRSTSSSAPRCRASISARASSRPASASR